MSVEVNKMVNEIEIYLYNKANISVLLLIKLKAGSNVGY